MADRIPDANRLVRDPQRNFTIAAAFGMNALKPVMHFQVTMLRMWADAIEGLAGNYEKGVAETTSAVERQADKGRAA